LDFRFRLPVVIAAAEGTGEGALVFLMVREAHAYEEDHTSSLAMRKGIGGVTMWGWRIRL